MEAANNPAPLLVDQAKLNGRFAIVFALLSVTLAFELFDFFIVSFLVSAIAPAWQMTFGQSAIVLLIASVGAMIGATVGGIVADRIGRKPVLIIGASVYPVAAALIGFIPEGNWIAFAALRLVVGLAYGFGGVAQFALVVELTPTRLRTALASASMVPIGVGMILAPAAMTLLYEPLGWRGLAYLCIGPIIFVPLFLWFVPESPSWLATKHRYQDAARAAGKLFRLPLNHFVLPPEDRQVESKPKATGRLLDHKRPFAFCAIAFSFHAAAVAGILLWGPLVVALLLGLSPQEAAAYFVLVGVSGLAGRLFFTFLPQWIGRRPAGQIGAFSAALLIAYGALFPQVSVLGIPAFVVALIAGAFFYDGAFANLQPHPAEIFPVSVAGRGMAVSHVASGLGKVAGPMVLAVLAGTSNVVAPAATTEAATPGFLTLAAFFAIAGLAFTVFGTETHRRPVTV